MSTHQHRPRAAVFAVVATIIALGLTACAPESTGTADPPAATATADDGDGGDGGDGGTTDGEVDPEQETRRSGPAVDFGGPPFGAQGDPEEISPGVWCATVGFFWGGQEPPEDVTFTVTGIISDPEGAVTAEEDVCGSVGAEESCIGFVMHPDTPFTLCSMKLTATAVYTGRAEVGFEGTLECAEPALCDAAIARETEQGPPIVVGG